METKGASRECPAPKATPKRDSSRSEREEQLPRARRSRDLECHRPASGLDVESEPEEPAAGALLLEDRRDVGEQARSIREPKAKAVLELRRLGGFTTVLGWVALSDAHAPNGETIACSLTPEQLGERRDSLLPGLIKGATVQDAPRARVSRGAGPVPRRYATRPLTRRERGRATSPANTPRVQLWYSQSPCGTAKTRELARGRANPCESRRLP